MKIGVASDHAGFEYKGKIAAMLNSEWLSAAQGTEWPSL